MPKIISHVLRSERVIGMKPLILKMLNKHETIFQVHVESYMNWSADLEGWFKTKLLYVTLMFAITASELTSRKPRRNYLDVIYNFEIARRVPKDGKISYPELARGIGVSETALGRLLRYAITNRIFKEEEPVFISHSAASKVLAEEPAFIDWIGINFWVSDLPQITMLMP